MTVANTIIMIVGSIVLLLGIGSFLNPNIARFINIPGSPQLKGILAAIIGVIMIIVGISYSFV